MHQNADKTQQNKSQSVVDSVAQQQVSCEATFQIVDNRPEAIVQMKLHEFTNHRPFVNNQLSQFNSAGESLSAGNAIQGRWVRIPAELAMQERAETNTIDKCAAKNDFMSAFRYHISTEPLIATRFHDITKMFFKNRTLYAIVENILKQTYEEGNFSSLDVLNAVIAHLPLDQGSSVEEFSQNLSLMNVSRASENEKINALQFIINAKFQALGIPPPAISLQDNLKSKNGEFDSTTWSFSISQQGLNKPMSEWGSTAYHESRHAEQFFMIARLIVHEKMKPPHSNQLPEHILAQAAALPPLTDVEKNKAETFYQSIFGIKSEHRQQTLKKLFLYSLDEVKNRLSDFKISEADVIEKRKVCTDYAAQYKKAAQEESRKWPDEQQAKNIEALNFAKETYEIRRQKLLEIGEKQKESYAAYIDLPEEKEAHMLGDLVKNALEKFNINH